jgi:hypothetical protein
VLAPNIKRSGCGKDSVEVGADGDGRSLLKAGTRSQEVSRGVDGSGKGKIVEAMPKPGSAGVLGKGWRRNSGNCELKVGDLTLMASEPIEDTMDARVGGEAIDLLSERPGLGGLGLPKIPYAKRHQE